ncbi:CILP2 [Branchiostoma lanceolatum]|uniref:CILP2 protein n=1 Tax=Branchiostoma lanceolatum TaxID=7740 RepID=A0A8K0EZJ6_BRALA|nr:CILP2 [Branchiostoma lanceolatum]
MMIPLFMCLLLSSMGGQTTAQWQGNELEQGVVGGHETSDHCALCCASQATFAATYCARICDVGSLNENCTACTCKGHVMLGWVYDEVTRDPVQFTKVYLGDSVQILGLSNRTGQFVIHGICANGENTVRLERDEYMPKYVTPSRMNETATQLVALIDPYEEPYFLEPQHKLRYEGQSVVMCCRAVGTPEPDFFEWYKDDVLLDSEKWGYNNTNELEIYNITREDAGDYSCTTRTPAGESTSNITTLTIHPNGTEVCNTVPNASYVQLSVPCQDPEQGNKFVTEVNIGVCANGTIVPCIVWSAYNYTNPGTCEDPLEYCCRPVAFSTKRLLCPFVAGTLTPIYYPITTACGCKKCDDTFIPTTPAPTTFNPFNNAG